MSPSSFPQMAAAIFATVLVMTPPTVSPAPQAAATPATATPVADIRFVDTAPETSPAAPRAQLDPDTPGCAAVGLAGRLPNHRAVSAEPKEQVIRPGLENPVRMAQGMRPAMHECVVDRFDPSDSVGVRGVVYRL